MIIRLLLFFLLLSSVAIAHDGEDDSTQHELENALGEVNNRRSVNSWEGVSPIYHFREGNWFAGIFIIVFWLLALKGFFDLLVLIIGRAITDRK